MQLTFTEILKYCIVASGQQIVVDTSANPIDTVEAFELTYDDIWNIFEPEVARYMKYRPIKKRFNRTVYSNSGYNFQLDSSNVGYVDADEPGFFPHAVTKAVPVSGFSVFGGLAGLAPAAAYYRNIASDFGSPNRLVNPMTAPINYDESIGELILPFSGKWDITALYQYDITITRDGDDKLLEVLIDDENTHSLMRYNHFKSLMLAVFKINVGSALKAYTNNFLEIANSGPQIANEGMKLRQETLDDMAAKAPTYLIG